MNSCSRLFLANHEYVFLRELKALKDSHPPAEFMRYFQNFWLGSKNEHATRWAIAYRTSADPRFNTNNISEAGHRSMKGLLEGARDLTLRPFVKYIDDQFTFLGNEVPRIIDGKVPPKKSKVTDRTATISASVNGIDAVKTVFDAVASGQHSHPPERFYVDTIEAVPVPKRLSSRHVFADHAQQ